jgi:hypothetical protein
MGAEADSESTNALVTETSMGAIPHKFWRGIFCPVALVTREAQRENNQDGHMIVNGANRLPVPERDDWGRFVYVLPGGGRATF